MEVDPLAGLVRLAQESNHDAENEAYWNAVRELQKRLPNDFDRICELSGSANENKRALAAAVLGQNLTRDKVKSTECARKLAEMIAGESSAEVIASIAHAFGHLNNPEAVAALVPFRTHPDKRVREAVTFGLLWQVDAAAVKTLVELSADVDRDVRSWANFGLGQIDFDAPELREALRGRLSDDDDEVRGEALTGLARRCDRSVLPGMIAELKRSVKERRFPSGLVVDAMEEIAKLPELTDDIEWQAALREFESTFDSPRRKG